MPSLIACAVRDFLGWAETEAGIGDLLDIEPVHVATWVGLKTRAYETQSVKQQLPALRHLFDWLVIGHVLHTNPASFVRGPKFSYTKTSGPTRLDRQRGWAMVKLRASQAGIETHGFCNHTFRGTGTTAYLENP